jgi:hypothetical protein
MYARRAWLWLLIAMTLGACGRLHAPRGTVPRPEAARTEAFGGWARVVVAAGDAVTHQQGELIAVGADTLWLLRPDGPLAVPTQAIQRAEVTGFDSAPGAVVGATALGILSTISNGAFLLLTAPAWLITGAVASSTQASASRLEVRGDLAPLALFARFPQGLPPGLDLATLQPRPPGGQP